jgi:hypothetical protein
VLVAQATLRRLAEQAAHGLLQQAFVPMLMIKIPLPLVPMLMIKIPLPSLKVLP